MHLIDGYNLLHAACRGKATESARLDLLARLENWCRSGGYTARIVFDATGGMRRREKRGPLDIRNVAQGRTADEEILSALASTSDRTAYTLVSNDRELARAAEKKGVKVISCEEFVRMLAAPPAPGDEKAAPGDVDYWMREFGLDEERGP